MHSGNPENPALLVPAAELVGRLAGVEASLRERNGLESELRAFRTQQFRNEVLGPLFRGVIAVVDRIGQDLLQLRKLRAAAAREPGGGDALDRINCARRLDLDELIGLLANAGIDPFRPKAGDVFDPKRHRAITTRKPADAALRGLIYRCHGYGYWRRDDDWLVRPALVSVYSVSG